MKQGDKKLASNIQKQVIHKAVSDPTFGTDIFSRIPIDEFSDKEYQEVAYVVSQYYLSSDDYLSQSGLLTLVEDKMDRQGTSLEKQQKVQSAIKDVYSLDFEEQNEDITNDAIQDFVKKSLIRESITKAVSKGNLANDEVINNLIDSLRETLTIEVDGKDKNVLKFFEEHDRVIKLLSNMQKSKYPTGFNSLDAVVEGGLSKGEVGMAIAESGGGKTSIGVNLARNYVAQGLNVLYLPLEEKLDRMVLRFEQLFANIGKNTLYTDGVTVNAELLNRLTEAYDRLRNTEDKKHWGELIIRKYQPQEMSPAKLRTLVSDLAIRDGQQIDVVFIDYPELMKNPYLDRGESESAAGGRMFEDLRAISQDYDFVCWTLSQLNRTGYGQDIKTAESIEGSKRKLNAVELAFTLNQTDEEFKNGFLRFYLDKVRNNSGVAYDKMQYIKVEPSTMTIRDETAEERRQHDMVLNQTMQDSRNQYEEEQSYSSDQVSNNIDQINEKISL